MNIIDIINNYKLIVIAIGAVVMMVLVLVNIVFSRFLEEKYQARVKNARAVSLFQQWYYFVEGVLLYLVSGFGFTTFPAKRHCR
jgi:hypothetical protein